MIFFRSFDRLIVGPTTMDQLMKRKLDKESIVAFKVSSKRSKTQQKVTKLENLNDNCLIKIFKHFAIKEFVNIVRYNERFLIPARDVFATKYSGNLVDINREVKTAKEAVDLLKYFGSKIQKLEISYYYSSWSKLERRLIDDAIIKYCQTTLVEIKFGFPGCDTMIDLKTPFKNVEKASFSVSQCIPFITDFGYWFPNAETLEIEDMQESRSPTIKNAPKLKNLIVCNISKMFNVYEIVAPAIFLSNPQLTSVSNTVIINRDGYLLEELVKDAKDDWLLPIAVWMDLQLDRRLPQLKSLSLVIPREKKFGLQRGRRHQSGETREKFQFDELTDLLIDFEESTVLKGLPIFTKKLEKLSLLGSRLENNCLQFIRKNNTPNCIKLMGELTSNNLTENLVKLLSTLPNLNELHFPFSLNVKPLHVIALLKKCKHLRKLAVLFEYYKAEDAREKIESAFKAASGMVKSTWKITFAANEAEYDFERYEKRFSYLLVFEKLASEA